jgi:hypothetical protein
MYNIAHSSQRVVEQTVTSLVCLPDGYRIASAGTDGFAAFGALASCIKF